MNHYRVNIKSIVTLTLVSLLLLIGCQEDSTGIFNGTGVIEGTYNTQPFYDSDKSRQIIAFQNISTDNATEQILLKIADSISTMEFYGFYRHDNRPKVSTFILKGKNTGYSHVFHFIPEDSLIYVYQMNENNELSDVITQIKMSSDAMADFYSLYSPTGEMLMESMSDNEGELLKQAVVSNTDDIEESFDRLSYENWIKWADSNVFNPINKVSDIANRIGNRAGIFGRKYFKGCLGALKSAQNKFTVDIEDDGDNTSFRTADTEETYQTNTEHTDDYLNRNQINNYGNIVKTYEEIITYKPENKAPSIDEVENSPPNITDISNEDFNENEFLHNSPGYVSDEDDLFGTYLGDDNQPVDNNGDDQYIDDSNPEYDYPTNDYTVTPDDPTPNQNPTPSGSDASDEYNPTPGQTPSDSPNNSETFCASTHSEVAGGSYSTMVNLMECYDFDFCVQPNGASYYQGNGKKFSCGNLTNGDITECAQAVVAECTGNSQQGDYIPDYQSSDDTYEDASDQYEEQNSQKLYGALAIHPDNGAAGIVANHTSQSNANISAKNSCGYQSCYVVAEWYDACAAYATTSDGGWGVSWNASSMSIAKQNARDACREKNSASCTVSLSMCSGNDY